MRSPIGAPSNQAWPADGSVSPRRSFTEVVLPAPLGPRKPKTSPFGTVIVSPARAVTWPYLLARSWVWMAGVSAPALIRSWLSDAVCDRGELAVIEMAADRVDDVELFPNQGLHGTRLV